MHWVVWILPILSTISIGFFYLFHKHPALSFSQKYFALDHNALNETWFNITHVNETRSKFSWEYLDFDSPGNCGSNKCFFRKSGLNHEEGYLVGIQKNRLDFDLYKTMMSAWNLSQRLEEEHHIRHFYLDPPEEVTPTDAIRSRLNALVTQPIFNNSDDRDVAFFNSTNNSLSSRLIVQKVKTAPSPSLLIGCVQKELTLRQLPNFITTVHDKQGFTKQFDEEMKNLTGLLEKEKQIFFDFQVLVDTKGMLYHIDLDRLEQGIWFNRRGRMEGRCIKFLNFIKAAVAKEQV